jgi:hypothetical protein
MKRTCLVFAVCLGLSGANAAVYSGGSGTAADPYRIRTAAHWTNLASTPGDWNKQFILTADIDLAGVAVSPIGAQGSPFIGVMDGNGHVIRNATLKMLFMNYYGVFGQIGSTGKVQNIGVENADIQGNYQVGGLAGSNSGTIISCYTTGSVKGEGSNVGGLVGFNTGTVTSCSSTCSVTSIGTFVGGLVGTNSGTTTLCSASGAVDGWANVGGLAGANTAGITSCYATGTVSGTYTAGGLAGSNSGSVNTSYSAGLVNGRAPDIGGLVGSGSGSVNASFWDKETSGRTTSAGGTGKTTAEMKTPSTYTAAGWDFSSTDGDPAEWILAANMYPKLSWEGYSGGRGTEDNPYQIGTVADWQWLITRPADWDKYFVVTNDIDFSGAQLTPVAPDTDPSFGNDYKGIAFTGFLDGNSHTLYNVKITLSSQDHIGLIGCVGSKGYIKNLKVLNAEIQGWFKVGILCGLNNAGTINNCSSVGDVSGMGDTGGLCGLNLGGTISGCYAISTVFVGSASNNVGGLCGYNSGTIERCYAMGRVWTQFVYPSPKNFGGLCGFNEGTIDKCYATGSLDSNVAGSVGGLCGINHGTISNCYTTGLVSGGLAKTGGLCGENWGTISNCYAAGYSGENVKGFCGYDRSMIDRCFWDMTTSGQTTSAGGTGKTTLEMQRQSTFTAAGWDFVGESANGTAEVWGIDENRGYPFLRISSQLDTKASADLNGDGRVDLADFALFAEQWMK